MANGDSGREAMTPSVRMVDMPAAREGRAALAPLLTDSDVAAVLAVRPDTVRRWAARGDLPSVRLGRLLRFRSEDVDRWIAGHATIAPASRSLRRRPGSIRVTSQRSRIGR